MQEPQQFSIRGFPFRHFDLSDNVSVPKRAQCEESEYEDADCAAIHGKQAKSGAYKLRGPVLKID